MAYIDEKDSGFRLTSFAHSAASILGKLRVSVDDIVNREVIQADGNNYPVSRPVDEIDMRVVVAFLGLDSEVAASAAAANLVIGFTEADGGSATLTIGKMLAGSISNIMGRRMGGFSAEQTFEQEGARTKTWSI